MWSGKPSHRGHPQPARQPQQYQDDGEDESNSGGTHYFHKANGFTINGGEFNNVRGNVNHYRNDLKGSTNYHGQSVNNSREFGTNAIFNGGDFTHANGDSNYHGPSNNYSGRSSHRDYREFTNYEYDRQKDREADSSNVRQDSRNPLHRGYEPSAHANWLRGGRGPSPPPKEDDDWDPRSRQDDYWDLHPPQGQASYGRKYDRIDEEGRGSTPQAREDYNQRETPPSFRERGNFRPQQINRNSSRREDSHRQLRVPSAQNPPTPANDFDSEDEVSTQAEQQITDALIRCLSLDSHSSQDQKNSKERVIATLQRYFETHDTDEYDNIGPALSQYQTSHKDVGQPQLRERLFKALRRYLHKGDWDGFFGAVSNWESASTRDQATEKEVQGDGEDDEQGRIQQDS